MANQYERAELHKTIWKIAIFLQADGEAANVQSILHALSAKSQIRLSYLE